MIAIDLVTYEIPPLKTSDTGLKALAWMEEFKVAQLPIVNNKKLLGLITEEDILDLNEAEEPLGNHKLSLEKSSVLKDQHIFDVFSIMAQNKLSILPVVDSENNYLGCVTLSNLVRVFSETSSLKDIGSVITLELNVNDYSISEIGKIIESDDAKILSLYVTSSPDTTKMELTIKVNKTDVSRILQTFFRFNYIVTASYQQSDYEEDIKKRYEAFMRYLNT